MSRRLASVTAALIALCAAPALADPPPAREVLQGFRGDRGLFNTYRDGHQAFLEVPQNLLGKPFLLATSIAGGSEYAGYQWWTTVATFEQLEDQLLLVEREVRYRVRDTSKPIADSVSRTYTDRLIRACPIAAMNGPNPVIDLDRLFARHAEDFFGRVARRLDHEVARIDTLKAMPENVECVLTMPDGDREGRFTSLAYSIRELPDPRRDSYRPRLADDRVGYFLTVVRDYTEDTAQDDRYVRYVNRWRLEKADDDLESSPVEDPIVFYIEDTVPFRFRQTVREAILEWNQAFDALGLQNAIVVRQQTETEFQDLDPEDARYNFFRWIVSDRAFAMGPSRVNPWTGQILDADIIFDESMVRAYLRQYDVSLRQDGRAFFGAQERAFLDQHPERFPFAHGAHDVHSEGLGAVDDPRLCSLGHGLGHELGLSSLAVPQQRPGDPYPDAFLQEIVKDVVMHEVGHTLGLRHNFRSSAWLEYAAINDGENPPAAICASVMDYNPVNVPPGGEGSVTNTALGPYDLWAIRYGYGVFDNEERGRAAVAGEASQPEYAYATDEDVSGPDPYTARWDLGRNPLDYAHARIDLSHELLDGLVERVVPEGSDFSFARRAVDSLLYERRQAGLLAARFVGGIEIRRAHRGEADAGDPISPVPAERQREALALITGRLLTPGAFDLEPGLVRQLGRGNWRHWGSTDTEQPQSYPYHDRVLVVQSWVLYGLLNRGTLQRLLDTEAMVGPEDDLLTLPELFTQISNAVFGAAIDAKFTRAGTARDPLIGTAERNLQRYYAGQLIAMALEGENGPTPSSARAIARLEIERLSRAVAPQPFYDPYTRAHLSELQDRLSRALRADFTIGGGVHGGSGLPQAAGEPAPEVGPDGLPWNR